MNPTPAGVEPGLSSFAFLRGAPDAHHHVSTSRPPHGWQQIVLGIGIGASLAGILTSALLKAISTPHQPAHHEIASGRPDALAFERMEEYRILVQNFGTLQARRQNTTNMFVSLNVLFLTAVGFVVLSSHLDSWGAVLGMVAISFTVMPFNLTWYRVLKRYQDLHFKYVEYFHKIEMEWQKRWGNRNGIGEIGIYLRQDDLATVKRVATPQLEKLLAVYFLYLYPLITLLMSVLVYLVKQHILPPLILN